MITRIQLKGLFLASAVFMATAVPALGAPAGDEYLPKVPGSEVVAGGEDGPGSTILAPEARGSEGKDGDDGNGNGDGDGNGDGASDGSSAVSDTLLEPVVLLLVVGVAGTALGMTLRRRRSGEEPDADDPDGPEPAAPKTPDGEIVNDEKAG